MANFKLKPEKCELVQKEVIFLGHLVNKDGVRPNPANTSKILDWPQPANVSEVRQFLGLCSYYRRFVKDFSTVAYPPKELTKNIATLEWNNKCQEAFDILKVKLVGP